MSILTVLFLRHPTSGFGFHLVWRIARPWVWHDIVLCALFNVSRRFHGQVTFEPTKETILYDRLLDCPCPVGGFFCLLTFYMLVLWRFCYSAKPRLSQFPVIDQVLLESQYNISHFIGFNNNNRSLSEQNLSCTIQCLHPVLADPAFKEGYS